MRKAGLLLGLLLLLLAAAACGQTADQPDDDTLLLYYLQADDEAAYGADTGVLGFETWERSALPESYENFLNAYFSGPGEEGLRSPFPEGLRCLETSLDETVLTVILSRDFDELTGIARSLAAGCIVRTLAQFPEITGVCLETEGAETGREAQVLSATDFVFLDLGAVNTETTVRLYFSDANGRYLVTTERQQYFESVDEIPAYVVDQLIAGPTEEGQIATMPEGTSLLGLELGEDGVCTVDLSSEFLYNRPATGLMERMTVLSLVNSLTELEPVKSVRILVEGETVGAYTCMDLDRELVRDASAIDMVREGLNEVDATMYVRGCSASVLAPVPTAIRTTDQLSAEETLLQQLTGFSAINGLTNPLPSGTVLLSAETRAGICRVDFSWALMSCAGNAAEERMAVQAITETLASLDGIRGVRITVNGSSDGFRYYPLDRLYTVDDFRTP